MLRNHALRSALLALAFSAASCSAKDSGADVDAGQTVDAGAVTDAGTTLDAGTNPDAGMTSDAGNTPDAGETQDSGPADSGRADGGLTTAALAGTFLANNPTTACYATILDNSVVEVAAVDADTVTLADGSHTFTCDLSGTNLLCAPLSDSSTVTLTPGTDCQWPYSVSLSIAGVAVDSFDVTVSFATMASPSGEQCANVLGVCNGQGAGTFARFVPSQSQPSAPAKRSIIADSSR
jgi:hypothetical protein